MPVDSPTTSLSLLEQIRDGNEDAWSKFSQLYTPLIYSWVRRAGLQEADAMDISQDVFSCVAQGVEKLRLDRQTDSLRAWLWTITRNCVRRHCNDNQRHILADGGTDAQVRMDQLPALLDSEDLPNEPSAEARLAQRGLALIRPEFNERTWQSFWRMTVEGHTAKEIGEDLELSQSAVRQAKYRVLCRLREFLDAM